MRTAFAVLAAAFVVSSVPAAAQSPVPPPSPRPASPGPRRFIIDAHQHYEDKPDYFDRLVRTYRPRNAMACVLTPMKYFDSVKKAAAAHPDVVIPYGHIDVDNPKALAEIEAFAAGGAKGIKMHTPKYNWDDFGYFPLYQKMQDLGLVALFHTGIVCTVVDGVCGSSEDAQPSSMARMRPSFLHTISRSFPRLRIQGAHLGNPWYDEAAEAARWQKNLYFDLTGSSLIKKEKNLAVFKDYLWWEGPTAHSPPDAVYAFEKLVFGTDEAPEALDNMLRRYEAMLTACGVPEKSRRLVYGETMARILGLPVRP
jgi:predicted TIM-barrel fold metal-dependent hydrolase